MVSDALHHLRYKRPYLQALTTNSTQTHTLKSPRSIEPSMSPGGAFRGPANCLITPIRQQAIGLRLECRVTLAAQLFQPSPIEDRDISTAVANHTRPLQF